MSSTRPDLKFSDSVEERLFYRKFQNLPPKESSLIVRIVDHKDYFSHFGEDADLIADAIYKTQLVIKTNNAVRYVTVSPQVLVSVLKYCLVQNAYKVEIYNKQLGLTLTASPGNLEGLAQEYSIDLESMLADGSAPIVASVKYSATASTKRVGVCMVDLLNKSIQIADFDDNDLFSNLELLLLQLNAKEVLLPLSYYANDNSSSETTKLFQVLNRIGGVVVGSIKSSLYTQTDLAQDLEKIIVGQNVDSEVNNNVEFILASRSINSTENALSLACCNSLVHYLSLLADESPSFTIDKYSISRYMKIDSSTTRALNIFPSTLALPMSGVKGNTVTSIFELLNKCKTAAGTRLLSQWLKQPLTSIHEIEKRHSLVHHFIQDNNLRVFASQEWLTEVPDIKRLIKRISAGVKKASSAENKKLEDVVHLYLLIVVIPDLLSMLQMSAENCQNETVRQLIEYEWLNSLKENYAKLLKFQELVETTIDLSPLKASSASALLHTDFNIKPEFDESLVQINDNLNSTTKKIKKIHEEVADDLNVDMEKKLKLEKHQIHGWCFRVTRNDSSILRNTADRYIELQTVKSGVFFTTKKLRALSQDYTDYSNEYNSKQKELIKEILLIALTYQTVFSALSLTLAIIDVLSSFANVAIFAPTPFVRPKLHGLAETIEAEEFKTRRISLEDSRHPVLEVQDNVSFICNDANLANVLGSPFAIITGPNMGGKSTYIRQIGVIALMNQVGSFIPALESNQSPELPIFDAILSRVGAGDSQLKGLSTFMIEMLETSSILASATHNSLIIIDELGRGTSTYDGFGLAWSISEHLISVKQSITLFATHFHELTKLSEKYPGKVQNLHVAAHIEKNNEGDKENDITLMYKVKPGISDKSFGIHVAELVKFPPKIINMAKRKASELQNIIVGSDQDPFVSNKKTKCTNSEIVLGVSKLKEILVKWRGQCLSESGAFELLSEEAITKLRTLVDGEYKDYKEDKFINEILTML
ncbi:DNA mismatch repair protein [Metschnikowia bicuspidata]|uniref:DNA mismatch repair protein n=1 Tax=Metschnikowia bicuspidata TaxID=27322 RepID=A0A4P9ZIV8_9ASCO|nr:DNA mismatch repair protein [Metschnikowia bicuspidata]